MKLPFVFYDHSKIQNGRHLGQNWRFGDLTLIREVLHFCGSYKLKVNQILVQLTLTEKL